MKVVLYSTHCPKCIILEKKLKEKDVDFVEVNDVDVMTEKGFMQAPMLEVDGEVMNYDVASAWLSEI